MLISYVNAPALSSCCLLCSLFAVLKDVLVGWLARLVKAFFHCSLHFQIGCYSLHTQCYIDVPLTLNYQSCVDIGMLISSLLG